MPNEAGSHEVQGDALGAGEVAGTSEALDWGLAPFEVPEDVARAWDARERGLVAERAWTQRFEAYRSKHPALAA